MTVLDRPVESPTVATVLGMADLAPDLVEQVVDRLAIDRPRPDLDGLRKVYAAWCDHIPFDNIVKRIHLTTGASGPIPNIDPTRFFELFLEHGTGGTCWPSSVALWSLLDALGFPARLASCCMADTLVPTIDHTHGTVLVRDGDDDWWVDTAMLTRAPLKLTEPSSLPRARTERLPERDWRVWWRTHIEADEMSCRLLVDSVDRDHCAEQYERSRGHGPFNASAYAVAWRDGRMIAIGRGRRVAQTVDGTVLTSVPVDDEAMRRTLVDDIGFSAAIVEQLPRDEAAP